MATPRTEPEASKVKASDRVIRWIEGNCCVPEGADVGKPVKLRPWQRADIRKIYDNPHVTRRAILSFGRKNAKTTGAALLTLVHLAGPMARQNAQLYSAAQSRALVSQRPLFFHFGTKNGKKRNGFVFPALLPSYVRRSTDLA